MRRSMMAGWREERSRDEIGEGSKGAHEPPLDGFLFLTPALKQANDVEIAPSDLFRSFQGISNERPVASPH